MTMRMTSFLRDEFEIRRIYGRGWRDRDGGPEGSEFHYEVIPPLDSMQSWFSNHEGKIKEGSKQDGALFRNGKFHAEFEKKIEK